MSVLVRDELSESKQKLVIKWLMANGFEYCQMCDIQSDLTFDHIIPKVRGGSNGLDNLCILCKDCNVSKGSRIIRGLIPLSYHTLPIDESSVYDLREGMNTFFGIVESAGFIGHYRDADLYAVEFSGENLVYDLMPALEQRVENRKNRVYQLPGELMLPLDPRFVLV